MICFAVSLSMPWLLPEIKNPEGNRAFRDIRFCISGTSIQNPVWEALYRSEYAMHACLSFWQCSL